MDKHTRVFDGLVGFCCLFNSDEKGRDVFYPWGKPGEAFYIEKEHKKKIKILYYFFIFYLIVIVIVPIYAHSQDLISTKIFDYVAGTIFLFSVTFYYFSMSMLRKNLDLYVLSVDERPQKNGMILGWFFLIGFPLQIIILNGNHLSVFFTIMIVTYIVWVSILFVNIYRTKGYYFTEKRGFF